MSPVAREAERPPAAKAGGNAWIAPSAPEAAFSVRVYAFVARIPRGRVVSYGQVARMLGCPRAARAVGQAMRRCPEGLPWQRVVRADGSVAGGVFPGARRALLESEGAAFLPDGRVDMAKCRWEG